MMSIYPPSLTLFFIYKEKSKMGDDQMMPTHNIIPPLAMNIPLSNSEKDAIR